MINSYFSVHFIQPNYRFGPFGFWTSSKFENRDGTQTNFGILDQELAVTWVHSYIEFFGGDPKQISIAGCSAGGQSVWIHLTNDRPTAKGGASVCKHLTYYYKNF